MIEDILSQEFLIKVNGKEFKIEFDNKAFAMAEQCTGKGLFYLYDELVVKKTVSFQDTLKLLSCGLLKHNSEEDIKKLEKEIESKPYILMTNICILLMAFVTPLMPPEILKDVKKKVSNKKKK